MGFSILSTETDGSDPRNFDEFGPVGGLIYGTSYGGGSLDASWTLDVPAYFSSAAARIGRLISIFDGPLRVWDGKAKEPERGAPWRFHAEGWQAGLADYTPVDTSGADDIPTTDLAFALDGAQDRGLPVIAPNTLTTVAELTDPPANIAELANQIADFNGQKWLVDRDRHLLFEDPPTTCDYLYVLTDTFGRTLDGNATDVWLKFLDSSDSDNPKYVTAGPSSGVRPFGRVEQVIDFTQQQPMLPEDAQLLVDAARDLLGERLGFTNTLTCLPGQLLSMGGLPVRLSTVRAGQLIRMLGASTDAGIGEASFSLGVQVVIGQTSYDAVNDVLQITPMNTVRKDLAGGLEDLYAFLPRMIAHRLDPAHNPL